MRGDRFKEQLPKFIGRINDMDDLFQAEDVEFEHLEKQENEFIKALFVTTLSDLDEPDYYLRLLENDYNLPHTGDKNERISSILAKMRGKRTTTEAAVLDMCKAFGYKAEYEPLYERYAFLLRLYGAKRFGARFVEVLKEIIPAHLMMEFEVVNGDVIYYKDRGGAYEYHSYKTGKNRHKVGTIYKQQYKGVTTRNKIVLRDRARIPKQLRIRAKEVHTGQAFNLMRGGKT